MWSSNVTPFSRETSISDSPPSFRRTRRKSRPWIYVIVGFVSTILTIPSLYYDFVQDDHLLIVGNPGISSWRNIDHIVTSDYFARIGYQGRVGYYRPLTKLSFLADRTLWGLSPTGFHLTNVVLGLVSTLLACRIATQLLPVSYAFLAGLFFAVHPGRVQAVSMITARSDLFAACFGFWAAAIWLRARDSFKREGLVAVLLFCALMGKESAISVVAGLSLWTLARMSDTPARGKLSTWCALGIPVVAYVTLRTALAISPPPVVVTSASALAASAGRVLFFYLRTLFLPIDTATTALLPLPSSFWTLALFTLALLLLPLVVLPKQRAMAVGASWTATSIAVLLLPQTIRNPTLEGYLTPAARFLYLPTLGVALLWAGLAFIIANRIKLSQVIFLLGVTWTTLLAVEFLSRLPEIRNDRAIAQAVLRDLERVPLSERTRRYQAKLLSLKADVLSGNDKPEEAMVLLEQAIALDSTILARYVNLARLQHYCGYDSLAILLLQRNLEPSGLGGWEYDDYMRNYEKGVILLADILCKVGRWSEAGEWLESLVRLFPASWTAHMARAELQLSAGDSLAATISYKRARELTPDEDKADEISSIIHTLDDEFVNGPLVR